MFAEVTFPLSRFSTFTYRVPEKLHKQIRPGICVKTPFRQSARVGFVTKTSTETSYRGELKTITALHEADFSITPELWNTLEWVSSYYLAPMGLVLKTAIPQTFLEDYSPKLVTYVRINAAGIKALADYPVRAAAQKLILEALAAVDEPVRVASLKTVAAASAGICRKLAEKQLVTLLKHPRVHDPFEMMGPGTPREIELNEQQQQVYDRIAPTLSKNELSPFLLKGVTGSGKTEVYLKLAQQAVELGRSVLVLVPEIALTPQVAKRFRLAFGSRVALWHSGMTRAEKGWTWQQLKLGKFSVVVGARSAIFTPLKDPGLIIIDEEQESSYKQENPSPRYNARDVALIRGQYAGATVLLTSATPALESYYNGLTGRLQVLELTKRYGKAVSPGIRLIDMTAERRETKDFQQIFSRVLIDEINRKLENREQIILLLNRRGYALILQCRSCGYIHQCPNCAVAFTYHRVGNQLLCHYCHATEALLTTCVLCGQPQLDLVGTGTQKVEDELSRLFPAARVIRMDVDTVRRKGGHHRLLEAFGRQEADILLGTQMIAKGLDFGNVTLVGVINADSGLFLPDFRAGERVFQLIYQVAGRAGRRRKRGLAIVQSYNPRDPYIQTAARLDIKKFYNIALAQRNELFYPPFSRLTRLLFTGKEQKTVISKAHEIKAKLQTCRGLIVLGPVGAPIERIAGRWRQHLIIKSRREQPGLLHYQIEQVLGKTWFESPEKGVRIQIDVDPMSML
ncbi:MAG: primosomal protein N' [FCB group bacterium]|nr:primosomal protein N' [FCB group bacterium]